MVRTKVWEVQVRAVSEIPAGTRLGMVLSPPSGAQSRGGADTEGSELAAHRGRVGSIPRACSLSPGQECAMGSLRRGAELGAALINAAAGLVLLERNLSSRDIKY